MTSLELLGYYLPSDMTEYQRAEAALDAADRNGASDAELFSLARESRVALMRATAPTN